MEAWKTSTLLQRPEVGEVRDAVVSVAAAAEALRAVKDVMPMMKLKKFIDGEFQTRRNNGAV